jgi:Rrf2 family cysteine metabolism transcriptional repressor
MRISAKTEYACLALIELARPGHDGTPKRIREIAEAQTIPDRYLVQILLQLKAAGLVHSARGSVGGYQLSRSADAISVADVVSAVDGPGDRPRQTETAAAQALGDVFERARTAELNVLTAATISHLVARITPHNYVI